MTYPEALEIVIARTKHERYRQLCADDHPDHLAWRAHVIAEASGAPKRPAHPTMEDALAEWWAASLAMYRGAGCGGCGQAT